MKEKLKRIFTNWRVLVLIAFLLFALVSIWPKPNVEGVAIRTVIVNSSASDAGMLSPKPTLAPTKREVITAVNNDPIRNEKEYYAAVNLMYQQPAGSEVKIVTDQNPYGYILETRGKYNITVLPELEEKVINETVLVNTTQLLNVTDNETNETAEREEIVTLSEVKQKTIHVNKTEKVLTGIEDLGLKVYNAPKSNIRKGLDLAGGTRVLLQPETILSDDEFDFLKSNMEQRLNVYGLSDVNPRKASDLSGNDYIIVEIAGANEQEVKDLLAKQGKFEAKIGNETVFIGGRDITYVARSSEQAGLDPRYPCTNSGSDWLCRFRFSISLTPDAAARQAAATKNLEVIKIDETGAPIARENQYLAGKIDFYLDDLLTDSLNIGVDLQGREVTEIQISGSGTGITQEEARTNTLANMKRLQTILRTGSLPVKIHIVKTDSISPLLGENFLKNALYVGIAAILSVALIIFIMYRQLIITIPIVVTMISEIILILGFAAFIKWDLDLASIAGILIAIGTGVDHLIIITDETLRESTQILLSWKDRIKGALSMIMMTFFTMCAAMIPLWWVGVGMLKGFAFTTIAGLAFGVFIARPAYAMVIEILLK